MYFNDERAIECVLWGTGAYAYRITGHINACNEAFESIGVPAPYRIEDVVDSSKVKHMSVFEGHNVLYPDEIAWNERIVIVAVRLHKDIDDYLEYKGCKEIYYFKDVMSETPILDSLNLKNLQKTENVLIEKIRALSNLNYYVAIGCPLHNWLENNKTLDISHRVGALACRYWDNIDAIGDFQINKIHLHKKVHVIAFLSHRLYNGGVEKTISELFKLFDIFTDYELIYISEENENPDDYDLPSNAKRIVLSEEAHDDPWGWVIAINALIDELYIDALICHDTFNEYNYYLGILAQLKSIRFITVFHNSIHAVDDERLKKLYKCYLQSDSLVVLSDYTREYWSTLEVNAVYIPNPVGDNTVDIKNNNRKDNEILWIGRLCQTQKNIFSIVPLMKKIIHKRSDIIMRVVGGEGENGIEKKLRELIIDNKLDENIILEGFHKEVSPYYLNSALMVMTSKFEGFPMTVAEAKRHGLPVVSFAMEDVEMLNDGKGCVCVKYGDIDSMANVIVDLLENEELRNRMAVEALNSLEAYSDEMIVEEWKSIL